MNCKESDDSSDSSDREKERYDDDRMVENMDVKTGLRKDRKHVYNG